MKIQRVLIAAALAALFAVTSTAQTGKVPRGASIYVEKMESDLDGFIRAEFVKQKVPLNLVLSVDNAELVITGSASIDTKRAWHEGWLTGTKDHASANIMVVNKETNAMLWAGAAGDRSLLWGNMAKGGQRKVAERLVKDLKKAITSATPRPR